MSTRPKPADEDEHWGSAPQRREKKISGVSTKAVEDPEADPFAEFHDGWEPVRKRKSQPPTE